MDGGKGGGVGVRGSKAFREDFFGFILPPPSVLGLSARVGRAKVGARAQQSEPGSVVCAMSTLAHGLTHLALIEFLSTDPKTEALETLLCDNSVDGDTLIDAIAHRGARSCVAALKDYFLAEAPAGQLGRLGIILDVFVAGESAALKVVKKGKKALRSGQASSSRRAEAKKGEKADGDQGSPRLCMWCAR